MFAIVAIQVQVLLRRRVRFESREEAVNEKLIVHNTKLNYLRMAGS